MRNWTKEAPHSACCHQLVHQSFIVKIILHATAILCFFFFKLCVCPPGGAHSAYPVLPWFPQDPLAAHFPQPGRSLRAHQSSPPHGRGQEAQAQLLNSILLG